MGKIDAFTPEKIGEGQKVIIYGAGRYGELALRGLESINIRPSFFIDADLSKKEYLGYEIHNPYEVSDYSDDIFLVATLNYYREIVEYLQSQDAKNIYNIIFFDESEI